MSEVEQKRRLFAILMENQPGALSRVTGLFSQRGFNIHTLTVAPTEDPTLSRLTLSLYCDDRVTEQIGKQLNKLVDIISLVELTEASHVERELMLVKVHTPDDTARAELKRTADIFRAQIVGVQLDSYTIQVSGKEEKITAFLRAIGREQIVETARTGITGLYHGKRALRLRASKKVRTQ